MNAVLKWLADEGISVADIREHASGLQDRFLGAIQAPGELLPGPELGRGNFLTFRTDSAKDLYEGLHERGVITEYRRDRLRFGFGIYQDASDVDRLVENVNAVDKQLKRRHNRLPMANLPQLRVVPLERIRPHEEVDPLRVERLATRIEAEGSQLNPVVCTEDPGGNLVLLDGATRTAALRNLDLSYGIVQLVEPESVILETWHHVVRQVPPDEILAEIEGRSELLLVANEGPPCIRTPDGDVQTVMGGDGASLFGTLSSLVNAYVGRWKLNRVIDPDLENVAWRYPDWAAVVEFPALTIQDVMKAAIDDDPVPAGMTRFVVPDRALRINVELSLLRRPGSELEKQELLDRLLEERARAGRIRRYEEAVVILDD